MTMHGPSGEGAPTVPLPGGQYPGGQDRQGPHSGGPYPRSPYAGDPNHYAGDPNQYPGDPNRGAPGAGGYGYQPAGRQQDRPARLPPERVRRQPFRLMRRLLVIILALSLLGALMFTGLWLITPSVSNAQALTQVIDRSHHAIYPGPSVPARFAAALISTEDHRFYSEPGVDPFAVARVIKGKITGGPDQGGATLYQQLAKMLYTPGRSGFSVEVEQIMLGIKLDFTYPKWQILRMYSDIAYFGNGYYGLTAASCGYFAKRPAQLSWAQAAVLAGLVRAPSSYDPLAHYAQARAREAHVLSRLVATGKLSRPQAARAYRQPLRLVRGPAAGC